jgi:hypothetical protein
MILRNCYRGACDTVQALHPAGTQAYVAIGIAAPNNGYSIGGALTDGNLVAGPQTYDVRLEPYNSSTRLNHGDVTPTRLALTKRAHRPIPPGELYVCDVASGQIAHLEFAGTGDAQGFLFRTIRRDARIADLRGRTTRRRQSSSTRSPSSPTTRSTTRGSRCRSTSTRSA